MLPQESVLLMEKVIDRQRTTTYGVVRDNNSASIFIFMVKGKGRDHILNLCVCGGRWWWWWSVVVVAVACERVCGHEFWREAKMGKWREERFGEEVAKRREAELAKMAESSIQQLP